MRRTRTLTGLVLAGWVLLLVTSDAAMKVKTDHDPSFDFTKPRTWAWNAKEPGRVITARTANDNPEEIKSRAEPVIMEAVSAEMTRRKVLEPASSGAPDLTIAYSLLLTLGSQSQQLGQFVPSTLEWGLPPFSGATHRCAGFEQGSLLLDMSATEALSGAASPRRRSSRERPADKRAQLIRDAVRDVLAKFPPKRIGAPPVFIPMRPPSCSR